MAETRNHNVQWIAATPGHTRTFSSLKTAGRGDKTVTHSDVHSSVTLNEDGSQGPVQTTESGTTTEVPFWKIDHKQIDEIDDKTSPGEHHWYKTETHSVEEGNQNNISVWGVLLSAGVPMAGAAFDLLTRDQHWWGYNEYTGKSEAKLTTATSQVIESWNHHDKETWDHQSHTRSTFLGVITSRTWEISHRHDEDYSGTYDRQDTPTPGDYAHGWGNASGNAHRHTSERTISADWN